MFLRRSGAVATAFSVAILLLTTTAHAKKCRPAGHLHHGQSSGQPSEEDARRDAIASWASFTALEYGNRWASFRNARYKKVSCYNREAGWTCNVEGNPCMSRRRRSARK